MSAAVWNKTGHRVDHKPGQYVQISPTLDEIP